MQAIPAHDVGLAAEDTGRVHFDAHQFEKTELSLFVVEQQVNVGIVLGFAARGRAEHVEAFDT